MDTAATLMQSIAENIFFFGIMFVVTIAVVIFVHEMGHYLAARYCGVFVEKFAFGFGKELFGFGDGVTNTRWSLHIFPIGGFVKLFGDVDPKNPEVWDQDNECLRKLDDDELLKSYCMKPIWQRMLIVFAGPFINILFTLLIFASLFSLHGQISQPIIINTVGLDTPAHQAGIEMGDMIVEMDGRRIRRLEDIYNITWSEYPAKPHTYIVLRDGEALVPITFTAREVSYTNIKGVEQKHGQTGMVRTGFVNFKDVKSVNGIDTDRNADLAKKVILDHLDTSIIVGLQFRHEAYGQGDDVPPLDMFNMFVSSKYNEHILSADSNNNEHKGGVFLVDKDARYYVRMSGVEAVQKSILIMKAAVVESYKVIRAVIIGKSSEPIVAGFAKLSEKTGEAAKAGWYHYLLFLGIISYMIAIMNLLPIPVLDGGYLVFLTFEAITGRPVSPRVQNVAMIIGLVILWGIMIFANVNDFVSYVNQN